MTTSYQVAETHGMLTVAEIDWIKDKVKSLAPDSLIVVIGGGAGTATLACLESHPTIHIVSIDILDAPGERDNVASAGYSNRLTQIVGDSAQVGLTFDQPIDLLIVDGGHSYDQVKADIAAWLPHVRPSAWVVFHDYGTEDGMWQMVKRAADEHFKREPDDRGPGCVAGYRNDRGLHS